MPASKAKTELRKLVDQVASAGLSIDQVRGYAFFDSERDGLLKALSAFNPAELAITEIPDFARQFGNDATRAVLQFVYEYFRLINAVTYDETAFENTWLDFMAELGQADWITRGVANLRYFRSDNLFIDLIDGVTIQGRSFKELASLGFGEQILNQLSEDWSGFGASSFVLVSEESKPKKPENLIELDTTVWDKAIRAVQALRLAAAGDLAIGKMWVVRAARFNVGIAGITQIGASIPTLGSEYVWNEQVGRLYPSLFHSLARLEKVGYRESPGNLDLALRSFMSTYERWPSQPDSKLLDTVTAVEALLGSGTEIAFKLGFRVAALLASSDKDRSALLSIMKEFYDTRSVLVHGAPLKLKHQRRLAEIDELRAIVRCLLRSFVAFAANPNKKYNKSFWERDLDITLVNTPERERLRAALGLNCLADLP
jgi:hypothetical protein